MVSEYFNTNTLSSTQYKFKLLTNKNTRKDHTQHVLLVYFNLKQMDTTKQQIIFNYRIYSHIHLFFKLAKN